MFSALCVTDQIDKEFESNPFGQWNRDWIATNEFHFDVSTEYAVNGLVSRETAREWIERSASITDSDYQFGAESKRREHSADSIGSVAVTLSADHVASGTVLHFGSNGTVQWTTKRIDGVVSDDDERSESAANSANTETHFAAETDERSECDPESRNITEYESEWHDVSACTAIAAPIGGGNRLETEWKRRWK